MRSSRGSAPGSFAAWTRPRRRRVRPRDEGPQRLQIPPIARVGPREFEAARKVPEALLVHEETKRFLSELALPDIRVAVELRSEVAHRVVQVERADPAESHGLVDRLEERLVAVSRPEVVARRERVACVHADPEAIRMGRAFHHLGELLEPIADDGARSRRILQDREHVRGVRVLEAPVEARRDRPDGVRLAPPDVGSRVEDHVADSEDLSPIELLHERDAAVVERVIVRSREVDQIVRVNDRARDPVRGHRLLERLRLLRRNRLRISKHAWTARKNLDCVGPDRLAALRGERDALRNRDVGAEVHRSPDAGIASTRMSLPMCGLAATVDASPPASLAYSARYSPASFRAFTTRYESVKWFSPCANESASSSHRPSSTHFRTTESRRNSSTSRSSSNRATVVSTPMKVTSKRLSSSNSVIASS